MAVLKMRESLANVHGQVNCNAFRDVSFLSPLLATFVRDGSFAFLLYVSHILVSQFTKICADWLCPSVVGQFFLDFDSRYNLSAA